jgi:dTDP-4-amino-4,6-dideoxygalactose transaminase
VGRPNIGNRERLRARIEDMLDRRWLSNDGPYVLELEQRLAELVGVKHCLTVCNGTMGLLLAARAAGLAGEVIVPSFTFVGTVHALQWLGITPVFCDVDPRTHNIDPGKVEELVTPATAGIMGVHLWGRPCDVEALEEIACRRQLKLLFDAAHAFACTHRGKLIGGFGDAEVYSFHATKFLNSFEGGAIATNDDELAETARLLRNFGFVGYDEVASLGINGRMNEVCAAMGLTSLESLEEFVSVNLRNYRIYEEELATVPGIRLIDYDEAERNNYQYVVLEVDASVAGVTRDELVDRLWAEGVLARRYFHPGCHRMEPYRSLFPDAGRRLPETEQLTERVLCLPTGTAVEPEDVRWICGILRRAATS